MQAHKRHGPMPHAPQIIAEALSGLFSVEPEDLCVVNTIVGTEGGAFSRAPKRSNPIVAGHAPVGTEQVVGRLMGFNPDDIEFADLAYG